MRQVYSTRLAAALGLEHDDDGRGDGLDGSETVLPTLSNEVSVEAFHPHFKGS